MIILSGEDEPIKVDFVAGSTVRLPDRATLSGRPSSFLPDYETSQAQHTIFPKKQIRSRTDSRFWRAILYALAVYVVISIIVVPILVTRILKAHNHSSRSSPPVQFDAWDGQSTSSNLNMVTSPAFLSMDSSTICDNWVDAEDGPAGTPHTATASHTYDATGSFSIRSNVSTDASQGIFGNLTIDINTDPSVKTIVSTISLRSSRPDLRSQSHLCFSNNGSDRGLTLYVPCGVSSLDTLAFNIVVLLPHTSSILNLSNLLTLLPMFSQDFGNLKNVNFNSVSVTGSHVDMSFSSLRANLISITSSWAAITGKFNVTQSLNLDNVEGPIDANITLVRVNDSDQPTVFQLDTGNGYLNANITLHAPYKRDANDQTGGYVGSVRTFGGPLNVSISHDSSTPSTPVDLEVYNNQAPSFVSVDSKFSGTFDAQTKLATVLVVQGVENPADDPSGSHRDRTFSTDVSTPQLVRGWIGWGKKPSGWSPGMGNIDVTSALSPITLQLGSSS